MSLTNKISAFNRRRKYNYFNNSFGITPDLKILDIGFNDTEYSPVDNFLEKNYPYKENITALGVT